MGPEISWAVGQFHADGVSVYGPTMRVNDYAPRQKWEVRDEELFFDGDSTGLRLYRLARHYRMQVGTLPSNIREPPKPEYGSALQLLMEGVNPLEHPDWPRDYHGIYEPTLIPARKWGEAPAR
ncbi:MAG: hypothetical protein AB7O52_16885 [Planctomycetota bacterium]